MKTKEALLSLVVLLASGLVSLMSARTADDTIYTQATEGIYKDAPRRAGGQLSLDSPGAIACVGLAAMKPGDKLVPYEFARAPLADHDVLVETLYVGVCHSDIHAIDGEFSPAGDLSYFPYVPGHEVVGRVKAVGKRVTTHKVGEIVGVGCFKGSCGECEYCRAGEENYCPHFLSTYDFGGGLSTNVVVPENFAFTVPDGMPLDCVGPILCAGVTTFSAIKSANIRPGENCAVVGFGGLGHMAAKFLQSMGANVTVFDINTTKAEAANRMGFAFVDANDEKAKAMLAMKFDFILSTVPSAYNIMPYLAMLRPHGTMHSLGLPREPQSVMIPLITFHNLKLTGSCVGDIQDHRDVLEYCAAHKIYPEVQVIRADQVNEVIEKLRNATGEFRYVIDIKTLRAPSVK